MFTNNPYQNILTNHIGKINFPFRLFPFIYINYIIFLWFYINIFTLTGTVLNPSFNFYHNSTCLSNNHYLLSEKFIIFINYTYHILKSLYYPFLNFYKNYIKYYKFKKKI